LTIPMSLCHMYCQSTATTKLGTIHGVLVTRFGIQPFVVTLCGLLIYRGAARAFSSDALALEAARHMAEKGWDRELLPVERVFAYLPFEHSEDLVDQERSVALFTALGNAEWLDYAVRHRDIVARFGRFPHRNQALGRESTAEETAFLATPGSSF
jgi:uncharacterized protein (DUF924 family)